MSHREHEIPIIQLGEVSQRVCDLQDFLGTEKGQWNYTDVARLIEYQNFAGLVPDGVPGYKTLAAIKATKEKEGAE